MRKWNLVVDVARCNNCNNCVIAAKDEHVGNAFPGYAAPQPAHSHRWIDIVRKERGRPPMVDVAHMPVTCNHCDDAPCVRAAPDGAVYKRSDGIVIIDPVKAKGRRDLVEACPYGAIWWNEDEQLPQKWIFDAHLLDQGWKEPRCAQVCPTGAIRALKADDAEMMRIAREEKLEVHRPELDTRPRVYYRNLHRITKCFIGGSIEAQTAGIVDCVVGASVTLKRNGEAVATRVSDAFGDFVFDDLDPDSGEYLVEVVHGAQSARASARLGESTYIGPIRLEATR